MTHGADKAGQSGQTGTGVLRITPESVDRAAGELTGHGDQMKRAGMLLQVTGVAPPSALPGGLAAKALTVATTMMARSATAEGDAACTTADSLRTLVDTVRTAEAEAAADLEGVGS